MLKLLARNSSIYYISTILTKGISFFLLPLYTSVLSTNDYGILNLISIFSTVILILFTLQVGQGVGRFYGELKSRDDLRIYTSTVAIFSLCSFGAYTITSLLFLPQIAVYLNLGKTAALFAILSVTLNGLFYMSQNQLAGKLKPLQEVLASMTYNLITISCTLYYLVVLDYGILGVFLAQCLGAFFGILVGYVFTFTDFSLYFSKNVFKTLIKYSLPLIPGAMSVFIYSFTDQICIKEMLGLSSLGVYSVGSKIASILTFTGLGVSAALTPLIYRHYSEDETPEKIALLFRIYSGFSFVLLVFLSFFAGQLISLLTSSEYAEATQIIPFLLLAIYLNGLTFFFPGLSLSKKTKRMSLISIIAGLLNVIFNVILIPSYGIFAAAVVTCISYGINFFLLYYFSQKEYFINVSLIPHLICSFLFLVATYTLDYFDVNNFLRWISFAICSGVGILSILQKRDFSFIKKKLNSWF
jgi:O-antigen/teichoic acid export membrane protein